MDIVAVFWVYNKKCNLNPVVAFKAKDLFITYFDRSDSPLVSKKKGTKNGF